MTGDAAGTPFGRYRLIALLGQGGMGEVWRAHDTDTDRIVAIKQLPANLSEDADFQRRFRREAHAAARLNSPHVIPIHHYGEIDGRLYVDMRLIEGRDLQAVLADGPLEPARAVHIIEQVAEALHAAHEVGLLHRDIKPSNVLLDRNDFAYLIDFGIARALDETRMTKSGFMIGTFQYIAPERLDSSTEDARADIYSLACVLYECLTGHPPFDGDTMARLVAAHLSAPPPRPSIDQPEVPPQVDEVIATGMAKDPDERYATTVELAVAAREAITVPLDRPAANPTLLQATRPAPRARQLPQRGSGRRFSGAESSSGAVQPEGRKRSRILLGAAAAVVVVTVIGVIGYIVQRKGDAAAHTGFSPTSPATGSWLVCDTVATPTGGGQPTGVTVTVIDGAPDLSGQRRVLVGSDAVVRRFGTDAWVIRQSRRSRIDAANRAVLLPLGLTPEQVAQAPLMSRALFDALQVGPELVVPEVPNAGGPANFPGAPGPVGTMLATPQSSGPPQYALVLTNGVQSISAMVAQILQNAGSGAPFVVAPGVLAKMPPTTELDLSGYPDDPFNVADAQKNPASCWWWEKANGQDRARVQVVSGSTVPVDDPKRPVSPARTDTSGDEADRVYFCRDSANFVAITGNNPGAMTEESLWWISDSGVRSGVDNTPQARAALGLTSNPSRAPWVALRLLLPGPMLSHAGSS